MHVVRWGAGLVLAALAFVSAAAAQPAEQTTYTYDALGRLVATENSGTVNTGVATSVTYDPAGNRSNYIVSGVSSAPPPAPTASGPVAIVNHSATTVTDLGGQTYQVLATSAGAAAVSSTALTGDFLLSVMRDYKNGDAIHYGLSTNPTAATDSSGMAVRIYSIGWTVYVYINDQYAGITYNNDDEKVFIRRTAGVIRFYVGTDAASAVHASGVADYTNTSAFYFDSSFEQPAFIGTKGLKVRFEGQ